MAAILMRLALAILMLTGCSRILGFEEARRRDASIDAVPTDTAADAPNDAGLDAPDAPPDAPIDAPVDAPRPTCDANGFPGATMFNVDPGTMHCYVGYPVGNLDWAASEAKCVSIGGHLATISSAAENTRVDSTSTSADALIWIGATRSGASFVWVTGEPFSYTNWIAGEPSGDGNCVHIAGLNDKWNDITCTYNGPTVTLCEVP